MERRFVLLSGAVSSGKSTLAQLLRERYGAGVVRTSELIAERLPKARAGDRAALQRRGQQLDQQTNGRWVVDAVARRLDEFGESQPIVFDAVRFQGQIDALRQAFGRRVVHIHLRASTPTLASRYETRRVSSHLRELDSYEQVRKNRTEARIDELANEADVVIDTDRNRPEDVFVRASARLILRPRRGPVVDVLVGGQLGSEGKGNIAAYLSPEYDVLLRSGGANAGHTVMTDGGPHKQHHLPSGTTLSEAQIVLSAGAVIHPESLLQEISDSRLDVERLVIDPRATVITDAHKAAETALQGSIGSTGSGVGAATAGRIMGRDGSAVLAESVGQLKPFLRPASDVLDECFRDGKRVFVEGTQGSALSLLHGSYPYVTSRDTTVAGLLAEAGIPPSRLNRVVMVCRTYPIRVESPSGGSSGPLSLELEWDEVASRSGVPLDEIRRTETTTTTGRRRRVGEFDWQLLARSVALNGPTDIALTFLDYLSVKNRDARRFEQLTTETLRFIEEVERVAGVPASLLSVRFHKRSIIDRRAW